MSGVSSVSIEVRRAVMADYLADVPINTIAARYNVSKSYPATLAKKMGLPARGAKHPPGKPRKAPA